MCNRFFRNEVWVLDYEDQLRCEVASEDVLSLNECDDELR